MLRSFFVACFAPAPASGAPGPGGAREAAAGLRARVRSGAVLAAALALAAADGEASGQARDDPWRDVREEGSLVNCYEEPSVFPHVASARGDFLGDGQQIGLALWNTETGCDIGRKDGKGRAVRIGGSRGSADLMYFSDVCRDPVSGRDHAILGAAAGQGRSIAVWSLEAGTPTELYTESWGGGGGDGEWGGDLLVDADGACLWRERLRRSEAFRTAMATLRIDRGAGDAEPEAGIGPLPQRALDSATVREHLRALRLDGAAYAGDPRESSGRVWFEGAVYADDAARESWFVVQILGGPMCNASGVVLLLERRTGQWKAIYDVAGGCMKTWHFGMRGMTVAGDSLYAGLCIDCSYWGSYADFKIDLRTNRAETPERGPEAPEPRGDENPELDDPVAAAFPE